jgi:hypothetical protein
MEKPVYKLTYFNLRGLAEPLRILFYLAGQEYEDHRYPITIGDSFLKPEYDVDKDAGEFEIGMDRIPILTVTDPETNTQFQLAQSKTIERYLAKKFGFMGKTLEEEATIDMICEHIRDIKQKYSDAKAKQKANEFLQDDLPGWLKKLDKLVTGDMFAVGGTVSLADITIQQFVCDYFDNQVAVAKALEHAPNLKGIGEFLGMIIKEWLDTRPVTPF